MTHIFASGKIMQRVIITIHQCLFLFPAPALHLFFAFEGKGNVGVFFIIQQFHRLTFCCIVGSFTGLMFLYTFFQIVGAAGVVRVVRTKEYVHVSMHGEFIFVEPVASAPLSHLSIVSGDFETEAVISAPLLIRWFRLRSITYRSYELFRWYSVISAPLNHLEWYCKVAERSRSHRHLREKSHRIRSYRCLQCHMRDFFPVNFFIGFINVHEMKIFCPFQEFAFGRF
jgi:hypothetical protein